MKILVGSTLFIQNYDIAFLYEVVEIPEDVLREFTENQKRLRSQARNGGDNGYDFTFIFKNNDSVRWFMNQGYILDFNDASHMSDSEIANMINTIKSKLAASSESSIQTKTLKHCLESYEILQKFKSGKISFEIPDAETVKKSTKPKGLFSRIFQ